MPKFRYKEGQTLMEEAVCTFPAVMVDGRCPQCLGYDYKLVASTEFELIFSPGNWEALANDEWLLESLQCLRCGRKFRTGRQADR